MAEAIVAQKSPYGVNLEAGKDYFWCACGRSANQPYCDGSHKAVGMKPMKFTAPETKQYWMCGCKATKGQPMCDGSHKTVA
jgi:CDGSH-type Zn-finger protein